MFVSKICNVMFLSKPGIVWVDDVYQELKCNGWVVREDNGTDNIQYPELCHHVNMWNVSSLSLSLLSLSALYQTHTLILSLCFSWILAEGLIGSKLNYFSVTAPAWCWTSVFPWSHLAYTGAEVWLAEDLNKNTQDVIGGRGGDTLVRSSSQIN